MAVQFCVTKTMVVSREAVPTIPASIPEPAPELPGKDVIMPINSANVKGEPGTGFEKAADKGEFECGNCTFFDTNRCGQEDMKRMSTQPRSDDGRVIIDSRDCCDYLSRVGRKDDDDDKPGE